MQKNTNHLRPLSLLSRLIPSPLNRKTAILSTMQRSCPYCRTTFEISEYDFELLATVSPVIAGKTYPIPPPTLCPDCRQQRRLLYRNERHFYRRTCDLTKKEIISIYSPEQPCKVYDQTAWWSDDWDQLATGREFDSTQPFFAQFQAMSLSAPRP